jgi:hypothetical protein
MGDSLAGIGPIPFDFSSHPAYIERDFFVWTWKTLDSPTGLELTLMGCHLGLGNLRKGMFVTNV